MSERNSTQNSKILDHFNTHIFDGNESGFIYHDLRVSIDSNLNYLSSLGLMCYTEYLGGLMPKLHGETKVDGHTKFNRFLYRMGSPIFRYKVLDENFEKGLKTSIYQMFRCGFVHEYFAKPIYLVDSKGKKLQTLGTAVAKTAKPADCIAFGQMPDGRIAMANMQYLRDFKNLLLEWRELLFENKDEKWVNAFERTI